MPTLNGDLLYEKLRLNFPDLKVLYMSGYTDDAVLNEEKSIDHNHYLQKPFAVRKLLAKFRGVIDIDTPRTTGHDR